MMSKDDHGPQRFSMLAAIRHMGSFVEEFCILLVDRICLIDIHNKALC